MADAKTSANVESVKGAFEASVDATFDKRSAAAEAFGVAESTLSAWLDQRQPKEWPAFKRLPTILRVLEDKTFIRYLCRHGGGEFLAATDASGAAEAPAIDLMGKLGAMLTAIESVKKSPTPEAFVECERSVEEFIGPIRGMLEHTRNEVSVSMAPPMRRVR